MENYKEVYNNLIARLKEKRAIDIGNVIKAFEVAEKLHANQFRKGGDPYILHPLKCAEIVEQLDFNTNVIASAILHDTVEDCNYSIKEIEETFNPTIAKIVDAVTAIESTPINNINKFLAEELTFQKLISIGKENLYAFIIKFADRLHNLTTISCFPLYKQLAKVKETEKWILPFINLLKCNYFHTKITNECFKIQHRETIDNYQNTYLKFHNYNRKKYAELISTLTDHFNQFLSKKKLNDKVKINIHKCTEFETYTAIKNTLQIKSINEIKQSFFVKVPTNKLYFVFENNKKTIDLTNLVFQFLIEETTRKIVKIVGYGIDKFTSTKYIILEDDCRNKYQFYIFNRRKYLIYKNGLTDNYDISYVDSSTSGNITSKYITVKTKSDEIIHMPEGSTVLDFAFRIHNDFGFACKGAYLNSAPTLSPINTVLSEGDKVLLEIDRDEKTGLCNNISQIRWIMYAKTERAQKHLVRHFESLA